MEQVECATAPVKRLRMSYEEYLDWADEDVHAEWVDGEVIVEMPPGTRHQDLVTFLVALIRLYVGFYRLGHIFTAPYEMRVFPGGNAREPDILFVDAAHSDRLTDKRLAGAADLIVEVVSDSSVRRDRADKFYEYQQASIREYWTLDPRPGKERADFWLLQEMDNGHGEPQASYQPVPMDETGVYRSTVMRGFWLRTAWLWADEKPDPLSAFCDITNMPTEMVEQLRRLAEQGPRS